jgi:hypothetical protein
MFLAGLTLIPNHNLCGKTWVHSRVANLTGHWGQQQAKLGGDSVVHVIFVVRNAAVCPPTTQLLRLISIESGF